MKISAGWCKGMPLATPEGLKTRPTSAKARSAVFNMLFEDVVGARILDLFAGTGAMGLEALSRGAHRAVFVERDKGAIAPLTANIRELDRRAQSQNISGYSHTLIAKPCEIALETLKKEETFDIIWMDPPYKDASTWLQIFLAQGAPLAVSGAWVFLESGVEQTSEILKLIQAFSLEWDYIKEKTYGETQVHLWRKS